MVKKVLVVGLLAGAGAYLYYKQKQGKGTSGPNLTASKANSVYPSQPSQIFPWLAINPPRVDNANQPWYNNSTKGMAGPAENYGSSPGQILSGSSQLVNSLSSLWGHMSAASDAQAPSYTSAGSTETPTTAGTSDGVSTSSSDQLAGNSVSLSPNIDNNPSLSLMPTSSDMASYDMEAAMSDAGSANSGGDDA